MKPRGAGIVIIGGGLAGLACSYFCAKAGVSDVIVLEQGGIMAEASGATFGNIVPASSPAENVSLVNFGDQGSQTTKEFALEEGIDLELKTKGMITVFWTEEGRKEAEKWVQRQQKAGRPVLPLGQRELRQLEPELSPWFPGGFYYPEQAHVNPLKLAGAFYDRSRQMGVKFLTFTKVTGFKHKGGRITTICTDKGDISASAVVNAAGPYASEVGKLMGADIPITPVKGQTLATEPLPSLVQNIVRGQLFVFQNESGNVICGGTRERVGFDNRVTYEAIRLICMDAVRLFPKLRKVNVLRVWAGLRAAAPDELPILGKVPHLDSAYVIAGLFHRGVLFAPISGKLVAQLIARKIQDPLLNAFSLSRFTNVAQNN